MLGLAKLILLLALIGVIAVAVVIYALLRPLLQGARANPQRMRLVWLAVLGIIALGALVGLLKRLV